MKQQQENLLKCSIDTHDNEVEFVCFNQFCQSNRIFCFECLRNGDHNIHSGDQRKIAYLFDYIENNSQKFREFISQIHLIKVQIIQSFSQLEEGLKNQFLLTKAELRKFDLEQLSTAFNSILQSKDISQDNLKDIKMKSLVLCDSINKFGNQFGLEEINIYNQDYQKMNQVDELLQNSQDIYYNKYKVNEAMDNFKKFLPINPNDSYRFHLTSEFLKMLENYRDANINIDQALKIDPKNPQLLQTKVEILKGLRNFEEAIQLTDEILIVDPNNLQSIITQAECLKLLRDYEKAIKCADRALKIDSKNLCSLIIKFESLYMIGNYCDAIVWAEKALEIDSMNLQALIVKSGSLRLQANLNDAIAFVDSALQKYPQNTNLKEIKSKCESQNINKPKTFLFKSTSNSSFANQKFTFNKK